MAYNHAQTMALLFGAYGQSQDTQRMKIYCQVLKDIPQEMLASVVQKAMHECKFLPSIAELSEACKSLVATVQGEKVVPDWGEAWHEIERAMQSTPWGKEPKFSHPAIEAAVKQYGWYDLQTCLASEFSTVRAQIRRFYDESAKRYLEERNNKLLIEKNPNLQMLMEKQGAKLLNGG